ncbi:DUF4232 domain-containing protein [Actinoallomurus sp. CA-150999]|uniref:DUF4232 domain-containing protein n=1 Tax=Actinoallomurus sp. CA-150999 TaxID=3239887 RepID=UPI003D8A185F
MELKRLRTAAVLACGGGMVALSLTACNFNGSASASGNSPESSSAPTASSAPTSSSRNTGSGGTRSRPTTAGQSDTPSCMGSELKAELQLQDPGLNGLEGEMAAEKATATLILTNRSSETCYLPAGWTPLGKGGENNYTAIPATQVNFPGAGMRITLRPGSSAFAGTKWHTTKGCPGGTTDDLGVAWHSTWIPLTYHGLDDGYQPPICDSLTLGTLQPTMNGVNFT